MCRLCHREVERISHLADCRCLRPIWDKFNTLHSIKPTSPTDRLKLYYSELALPNFLKLFPPHNMEVHHNPLCISGH